MKKQQGFTLIELMIVVAIVAILAAIAMPSYSQYVTKSNRADAKVALMKYAQMQESYFVQYMSYAKDLTTGTGGLGLGAAVVSENGHYSITMTKVPANCDGINSSTTIPCTGYTLTATRAGRQANDDACKTFTIDQLGIRAATDAANAATTACW